MIVTKQKPFEEIVSLLKGVKSVLVLGCRGCAGIYRVGGEKQANTLAIKLSQKGFKTFSEAVARQCDPIFLKKLDIEKFEIDGVLSLACGVGVVTFAEVFPDVIVYPGVDTLFCGAQMEKGFFYEKCKACGSCFLHLTAGLCPITLCPKGMLNGPCGGSFNGRCEVNQEKPCVWEEIIKRLEKQKRLEILEKIFPARDYSLSEGRAPRIYLQDIQNNS